MNQPKYVQESKIHIQRILSLKSIAVLLGTAMLFCSCENKIERIKELSAGDRLPGIEAENFEAIYSDSAVIESRLITPLMIQYNEEDGQPYTEFPKGVKIERFGPNRQVDSRITSDYAQYLDQEKKWIAKNNVVVINQNGDTLKTEELNWEGKTGKIYSDKFVKIIREDQIISGIGFESDQNMANWQVKKVKGILYLEVNE